MDVRLPNWVVGQIRTKIHRRKVDAEGKLCVALQKPATVLGIKLKKVHRAITFEQECWICHEAIHEKKTTTKQNKQQKEIRREL